MTLKIPMFGSLASIWLVILLVVSAPACQSQSEDQARYYAPKGSELMVLFSMKPKIQEASSAGVSGTVAEVTIEADTSFQRAEFYTFDRATMEGLTKDVLIQRLTQYAELNGLQFPDFTYSETPVGRVVSMRSTKFLEDSGRRIPCTYFSRVYLTGTTYLALMVGAPASRYPTDEIQKFLDSVTRV